MSKLKSGDVAPIFTAKTITGDTIDFPFVRSETVLLSFFRYAGCPWCNLAILQLNQEYPSLKKRGLEVIAVVQSTEANIKTHITDRHDPTPQFPIIADPDASLYKKYGVEINAPIKALRSIKDIPDWIKSSRMGFKQGKIDGSSFLVPADFIINAETGRIIKARYGQSYGDNIPFIEVYDALLFGNPV